MTVEAEILAISDAWDAALVANDADAVAGFMTDDWVYVGPSGATPKAGLIAWIATGRLAHHTMRTIGETRIAVHEGVVITTARKASTGAWEGSTYTADEWITEVFVQDGGQWRSAISSKCPVQL